MTPIFYGISGAAIVIILGGLFLYYRKENSELEYGNLSRRPLPGKFFIPILIICSILGMAITEWQGVCSLSPLGFLAGIVAGTGVEFLVWKEQSLKLFV